MVLLITIVLNIAECLELSSILITHFYGETF